MTKKCWLANTLAIQRQTQINQNADFAKPDLTKKQQRHWNQDNFTNSIYPKFCEKKTRWFWEPTQPTTNKAKATKQSQLKPLLTKTQTKNLEVNFSDSTNWNRTFADQRNADKRKRQTYKPQIEKKTQADIKMKAGKGKHYNRQKTNSTTKQIYQRAGFVFSRQRLTACVTCGWAGVDKTSRAGKCWG